MKIETFFGKVTTLTLLLLTSFLLAANPNVYDDITFRFENENLITTFEGKDEHKIIHLNNVEIQEGPVFFKLQANLSQAKMPV